jgi:2,4-dienoyl-CoA reductase-like NADH-dependent reductase (Old Yellow Enzyme family)
MSRLFESTAIKNLQLDNRFVRSATYMGMAADDGACTPRLIDAMAQLARGGVGLIFTGFAYVQPEATAGPWMMGCYDDHLLPGLTEMTSAVHEARGKIALQMEHSGVFSASDLTGQTPLGPSALSTEQGPLGRAMTQAEIQDTVDAFGAAAARAVTAGFDAVQVHGAHGFLLSQFLSPFFNQRTDAYGGSLENRARMLMQVVSCVQDAVDDAVPVFVKLNSEDLLPDGFSRADLLQVCAMLEEAGIDAIELSGGTSLALLTGKPENSFAKTGESRLYWREAAEEYKAQIGVPLMLVGGIRSLQAADELVSSGVTDYVSLCRPLIRQPDLINRWRAGESLEAECQSCNGCLMAGLQGEGVHCVRVGE